MNWLTDKTHKYAFGVPPKNGFHSIRKVLNGQSGPMRIPWNRLKNYPKKVFVVRHPVDRFKSLWRNKCRDAESGLHLNGFTPEQLFEHIQKARPDDHWQHQVELLKPFQGKAEVVRIEDMPQWWREHMDGDYPKLHTTVVRDEDTFSEELLAQVAAHYADDLALYYEA